MQEEIYLTEGIEELVKVKYYSEKDGSDREMFLPPGDVILICNVFYEYIKAMRDFMLHYPEQIGAGEEMRWDYHLNRCRKVQETIEQAMDYSTEEAIRKCRKVRNKKEEDVGEDAMVLMAKYNRTKKTEEPKACTVEQAEEDGQMRLEFI